MHIIIIYYIIMLVCVMMIMNVYIYNLSTFDQVLISVTVIMNHSKHSNSRQESGVVLRNFLIHSVHANLK